MSEILSSIGFIGLIVFFILLIKNAIKKQSKKSALIGLGMCLVLLVVGIAISDPSSNPTPNVDQQQTQQQQTQQQQSETNNTEEDLAEE